MAAGYARSIDKQLEETLAACLHLHQPKKVVLALSGGLDSMVLLELLHRLSARAPWQLSAVHVHHGLQPQADEWLQFCQRACAKKSVLFAYHHLALDGRHNLEARARDARYQQLAQHCAEPGSVLLTAHHADDQLETLLLALKRGSGLTGLSGMASSRPFAAGLLVRPLLTHSRVELEQFADFHQLHWVEDPSNQDPRFDRNFLRQQVLPLLAERWPGFSHSAARSMAHCAAADKQLEQIWQQQLQPYLSENKRVLQLAALQGKNQTEQNALLRSWLKLHQLNPELAWLTTLHQQVIAAKADAMPELQLQHYHLRRFQGALYLCEPLAAKPHIGLVWQGQAQLELPAGLGWLHFIHSETAPGENWLPLAETTTLELCFGQLSLPFKPAGAQHHKPLKQWCKLWQIPPWQRPYLPLLLCHGEVQLVAGYASCVSPAKATLWCLLQAESFR
ncbi:tRNA lysidine(34) synthetase TilS [Alkalimonas amylolytica]|uniref:tRNA(Ile)-lysidine synthase n=1 Tax=Alkalimonas amylolytica TaxID=152573 RepID=A0A1H4FA17_ALKAM|nr:tRNA lysidine(34) synthetase TilS [Alkalimonas amylolytica]SEA93777.1 tRNA(Ile)-lysidine synthase [Alkalimonas amylolytica]